jgi:hypothetical protein
MDFSTENGKPFKELILPVLKTKLLQYLLDIPKISFTFTLIN